MIPKRSVPFLQLKRFGVSGRLDYGNKRTDEHPYCIFQVPDYSVWSITVYGILQCMVYYCIWCITVYAVLQCMVYYSAWRITVYAILECMVYYCVLCIAEYGISHYMLLCSLWCIAVYCCICCIILKCKMYYNGCITLFSLCQFLNLLNKEAIQFFAPSHLDISYIYMTY